MKKYILLLILIVFAGCYKLPLKPFNSIYGYSDNIYGIIENEKINRMKIPENDIEGMNKIVGEKYGIEFKTTYNVIIAPKRYNKDYKSEKDIFKNQYIKFYNDIKIKIEDKEFIIPKEKIILNENESDKIFYEFPAPIDIINTSYDGVIIDLGVIEIYDKTGKTQKSKKKIPPFYIKKTYYVTHYDNGFVSGKVLYNNWVEYYPDKKEQLANITIRRFEKAAELSLLTIYGEITIILSSDIKEEDLRNLRKTAKEEFNTVKSINNLNIMFENLYKTSSVKNILKNNTIEILISYDLSKNIDIEKLKKVIEINKIKIFKEKVRWLENNKEENGYISDYKSKKYMGNMTIDFVE